jgi:hypothetical protein
MTVAELIRTLQALPADAIATDTDDLEVIGAFASPDRATVSIWTEQK